MLGFLIVGVVCLILAYYSPRMAMPPPLTTLLYVVGWVCIAVAIILLLAFLLGIPLVLGPIH